MFLTVTDLLAGWIFGSAIIGVGIWKYSKKFRAGFLFFICSTTFAAILLFLFERLFYL